MRIRTLAWAAALVLAVADGAWAQRVEVSGLVGWTYSDGVESEEVVAGDGNTYDAIDVKDGASWGVDLGVYATDRVQVGAYGGGRPDRMANSHTRARSLVFDAVTGAHPMPFGAEVEVREAWITTVVEECIERFQALVAIAEDVTFAGEVAAPAAQAEKPQEAQAKPVERIAAQPAAQPKPHVPVEGEEGFIAPAKEVIAEIEKMGGKAVACNGDVAKPDFGDRIIKTAVDAFGDCHVVVNNAGYTWDSVIQKMSDEQWYAILDVHLTAPFRILRAFQQHFRGAVEKERTEGKRIVRKVVNISSTSGVNGNAGQSNYSAGKAGIVGLTKTLAKEFGRYDVTVNAVAFGYIQTRLTQPLQAGEAGEIEVQGRTVKVGVQGGRIAAMNQMIPLGRGGFPEEAAGAIYLFCSPDSDFVSGQTLVVTGGA